MKNHFLKRTAVATLCVVAACALRAQDANQVDQLRAQLAQLQDNFTRTIREQQAQIDALKSQLTAMTSQPAPGGAAPAAAAPSYAAATPAAYPVGDASGGARAGSAYMNISFDALADLGASSAKDPSALLQLGDHDPVKRGYSLRNAEISLDGAVDPYLKGFANIVLKLSPANETEIELEETYLQTTSLPANLQVKAGQFFANFGRQNSQHPHQWAFVDQPLILGRAFGPEGLRSIGTQATWLAPTPFYTEVSLGIFDGEGGTAFNFRNPGEDDGTGTNRVRGRTALSEPLRGPRDLLFAPRIASSFDLTDTQTVVAGLSAALGPNSTGPDKRTEIYGADLYWKWKPANASAGFPFVSWQTEALYSHIGAGADPLAPTPLPAETLKDSGIYSQLLWGFRERWVAGFRADYVDGNKGTDDAKDPFRNRRTRLSPDLTFYPSEFSKLRFQYNYDRGETFGTENSFWMQLEFMLGAHGAHKF